ncbi:hypothetical protein PROFUN_00575 [Planoprotostelium fungivorum]|uniref:Uncharacterized protein n=1 Tax=Planoprotostelium fungivorum TaxID=1890364 RepID=A0A2P6N173_9EUKA|nr:hypothetical protein PROFUN_00575 [Planoprotostelium fungivorum]
MVIAELHPQKVSGTDYLSDICVTPAQRLLKSVELDRGNVQPIAPHSLGEHRGGRPLLNLNTIMQQHHCQQQKQNVRP